MRVPSDKLKTNFLRMKREKLNELISWKGKEFRKPLIIKGARQVGKTWLMKEFGKTHYTQTVYLNFEKNKRLASLFTDDFDIKRIIIALQAESGITINADNTLIIFDEIQAVPEALTSLKYFYEEAPQFHIIAAGSLLGVAMHSQTAFPVGKVEFMNLHPLSFKEFLNALGESALVDILESVDWKLIYTFKSKYIELLKQYYYVGGMPEVVEAFMQNFSFTDVRKLQKDILNAYEQDFSKYAPVDVVPKIRMVWNSIPAQLAKENKKFIYGALKEGARAKDFELAIQWLADCGLIYKVFRVNKPGIPLKAYEDRNAFKLFLADVGLFTAMGNIDAKSILEGNSFLNEFKGALSEQFVLQQLLLKEELTVYYWSAERSTAEIDFIIQHKGLVTPIEVKSEENLQAKSLKVFSEKYKPKKSIRISMSDYRVQEWLTNVPLYSIGELITEIGLRP